MRICPVSMDTEAMSLTYYAFHRLFHTTLNTVVLAIVQTVSRHKVTKKEYFFISGPIDALKLKFLVPMNNLVEFPLAS